MAYRKNYWQEQANQLDGEGETDFFGKSKFNASGLINVALERAWSRAFNAQVSKNFSLWNTHLDSLWIMLAGDIKPDSPLVKQFDDIEIKIGKSGSLHHSTPGFKKTSDDEKQKISLQYRLLMEKSLFLKRLQNAQGKGSAYVDEQEDEFE